MADFGIALAVEQAGGARMTQTGLSLGTPAYMAPEQAMGERSVDARADIYALSAVLALYLNDFVLIAQLFEKVPALKALAPTQSEPPFKAAQFVVLALSSALLSLRLSSSIASRSVWPDRPIRARTGNIQDQHDIKVDFPAY